MRGVIVLLCKIQLPDFTQSSQASVTRLGQNSLQASFSHRADLTMKSLNSFSVLLFFAASCFHSTNVAAVQVWQSTFDSGPDGVVDIAANEDNKVMIGPVSNGRLQITSEDVGGSEAYSPDKAGRPLQLDNQNMPIPFGWNHSMSGDYKFSWSDLNTAETQAYELVGFLGKTGPQTRQVMGALLRHWQVGGDYYVGVDIAVGSVGITDFGYREGSATDLGSNATSQDYELKIEYDGTAHSLALSLLNSQGTFLGGQSANLVTDIPGLHNFGTPQQELGALALTHLGWEDYTGNATNATTTWQVNTLTYYDTATVPGAALTADYNHNGVVDAADYIIWRNNVGATGTPGSVPGDGTGDGVVDQNDYNLWRSTFGLTSGGGGSLSGASVPEPSTGLLAFLISIACAASIRKPCRNGGFA
jgi:hypothetical protein